MNRSIKALILAALVTALFASMQMTVLGAELVSSAPATSSQVANSPAANSPAANSPAANSRNDILHAEAEASGPAKINDIAPINEDTNDNANENARVNPNTGAEDLVIPGIVALLATATAAITLSGRRK